MVTVGGYFTGAAFEAVAKVVDDPLAVGWPQPPFADETALIAELV
jgi:hypothetical protein